MERKKILAIINPASGKGKRTGIRKYFYHYLDHDKYDYEEVFSKAPGHAAQLAAEAVEKGFDVVVAVGGDGSVKEIATGLVGTKVSLGIIPVGSGNGLARHLFIPLRIKDAIRIINQGRTMKMDTVNLNDKIFVNVAGIGFDALVAWEFANFGKRGFLSYVMVVFKEYYQFRSTNYLIEIDGVKFRRKAFILSVANSSQFGNNATIAPGASVRDGMIDLCILKRFPWYEIPVIAYRLFTNRLNESKHLEILRGKEIHLLQSSGIVHLDGDPYQMGNQIDIKINPRSLNVIVP